MHNEILHIDIFTRNRNKTCKKELHEKQRKIYDLNDTIG